MSKIIDLRSDTVTKPTAAMRHAMAEAEVGDDVYGEDPTVNRLEERAAAIFGKEAALFVPSGCMGNTIGIKLHTRHGQEVLCESRAHVLDWELAMMAWFAGCVARPVAAERGLLTWDLVKSALKPPSPHNAPTGLVCLENTHNMAGGTVYPQAQFDEVCDGVHNAGLPVHLDGARVFNAAVALGTSVAEVTRQADTVMFCLSKGLGAPVGSLLVGPARLIGEGRLLRKRLGGGMRQAGVLAAAGLIALEEMPLRLHEDHANARLLAQGLAQMEGIAIDQATVQTNIVIGDVSGTGLTSAQVSAALKERGVLANGVGPTRLRFVTHLNVTVEDCKAALEALSEVLTKAVA